MTNRIDSSIDDINSLLETMLKRHTAKQQVTPIIRAVVAGFQPDPGTSDLDNAQPIVVRMTLGDYRRAQRLLYDLEDVGPRLKTDTIEREPETVKQTQDFLERERKRMDEKRLAELDRRSGCSDV